MVFDTELYAKLFNFGVGAPGAPNVCVPKKNYIDNISNWDLEWEFVSLHQCL